jgi:hypothetical protein
MGAIPDTATPPPPKTTKPTKAVWSMHALLEEVPLLGAVAGGVALVTYVLLSFVCSWYYAKLGVTPDEVGLDQATLLVRTAVGMAGVVPFAAAFAAFCMAVGRLVRWLWAELSRLAAAVVAAIAMFFFLVIFSQPLDWLLVAGTVAAAVARVANPRRLIGLAGIIAIAVTAYFIVDQAHGDAHLMASGQRPVDVLSERPPWDAAVVRVHWADPVARHQPALPTCLLFLGESHGTSVFFDPDRERSLRLPTSMVAIEILPAALTVYGRGC